MIRIDTETWQKLDALKTHLNSPKSWIMRKLVNGAYNEMIASQGQNQDKDKDRKEKITKK